MKGVLKFVLSERLLGEIELLLMKKNVLIVGFVLLLVNMKLLVLNNNSKHLLIHSSCLLYAIYNRIGFK